MAERLSGANVIYSRKPSPNFLGIKKEFDEDAFRDYIRHTVDLTKECHTEYIFRDIYKLHGNLDKLKRAVDIVRELTGMEMCYAKWKYHTIWVVEVVNRWRLRIGHI